jgi:hypothetical protein
MKEAFTQNFSKIKSVIILFSLLTLFAFATKGVKNSLYGENLHGRIRSVTEFTKETSTDIKHGVSNKIFKRFDDKGHMVEMQMFVRDSILAEKIKNRYNGKGKLVREDIYDGHSSLLYFSTYKSRGNQNLKITTTHTLGVKPFARSISKYDPKGHLMKMQFYKKDGNATDYRIEYKRDELGNIIEQRAYRNDSLESWVYYKYNENNLISEEFNHDGMRKVTNNYTCQYEYDVNNNWIKRTHFEDGEIVKITRRKIEYY